MLVYSLYIISKSGGVIFYQGFSKESPKLTMNDTLRLGSTFHGFYTIASKLSPTTSPSGGSSSGLQVLQAESFKLQCFQTPTGVKFVLIVEPSAPSLDSLLKTIYELYTDYVLKNPFYELEQPIRCQQFDVQLEKLLATVDVPSTKH